MSFNCAWCQKILNPNQSTLEIEESISHTMCISCIKEMQLFEEIDIKDDEINLFDCIPWGLTTIDKNNKITNFTTTYENHSSKIDKLIGKDYFKDIIPFISNKNLRRKLGGLRRRKHDGFQEFYYIINKNGSYNLIQIQLNHFVNSKFTNFRIDMIQDG